MKIRKTKLKFLAAIISSVGNLQSCL